MSSKGRKGRRLVARLGLLIALGFLWTIGSGTGSVAVATEESGESLREPVSEPPQEASKPSQGKPRRLESLLFGATPEERARLAKERERISAAAAAFGTDPTAIVGYYQLGYGHSTFTNDLRLDTATAVIRLPLTPNWFFQATMPYVWADLDQPRGFTENGTGDMVVRTGGRLYASRNLALFLGTDASFPTASEDQLGTGKYTLGPGAGVAIPMPRLRSLFFTLVQDFHSVGGDSSRADLDFMQIQSGVNTIWTERWWTIAQMTWAIDWNNNRKDTINVLGEVGHRFDKHWNVFAGPGLGVVGRDTFLGLDWTVRAGVRWVFQTPLFPERLLGSFPRK